MNPQLIGITILAVATATALGVFSRARGIALGEYWRRACTGPSWHRAYPTAATEEIRHFLYQFVDAFGFRRRRALQFLPSDRVLAVYRALYPNKNWPDALELETFAISLKRRYDLDLRKLWREDLTLGEIFETIHRGAV